MRLRKEERIALGYDKPERKVTVIAVAPAPVIEKVIPMPNWSRPMTLFPVECIRGNEGRKTV